MKTSCFSLSAPMIRENFRRFWALPVVGFLGYFICGIIPILTNYSKLDGLAEMVDAILNQTYIFYNGVTLLVPIVAASLVFRYLYSASSVNVMHSLPFTRASLFNSNLVSGFILSVLPVLATGVILLCLAKPVHYSSNIDYNSSFTLFGYVMDTENQANLFSHSQVLIWIAESLLVVLCVYAISIFAGALTGNAIIHFLTAIWFNFLGFVFMIVVTDYFKIFLYGYDISDSFAELIENFSPFTGVRYHSGDLSLVCIICYIVSSLVLIVLSARFYHIRKVERTQKSFIFPAMDHVVCYLITFFGMTVAGLALHQDDGSRIIMYAGIAGGSIAAFIIGRMIVKKSLRIFNAASLKGFAIYAAAAVIFICVLAFDLTGYIPRIPKATQISQVSLLDLTLGANDGRFQTSYYKNASKTEADIFKSKENIQAARELHQSVLNAHPVAKDSDMDSYSMNIKYQKKGLDLERTYILPIGYFNKSASYKKIFESKEFKDFYSMKNIKGLDRVKLMMGSPFTDDKITVKKTDHKELLACLEKDFQKRTYEEQMDSRRPYGSIMFEYKAKSDTDAPDSFELNILYSDTNTLKWLKSHHYTGYFEPQLSEIESISVSIYDMEHFNGSSDDYANVNPSNGLGDKTCYLKTITVKDKKQVQQILNTCELTAGPYECVINFKKDSRFYKQSQNFFYSKSSLPDFLKDKLK